MWPEEEQKVLPMTETSAQVDYSKLLTTIKFWRDVMNARLLALLSLLGTLGGFGYTIYDPNPARLWCLAIYAILCQFPILWLYLKKG